MAIPDSIYGLFPGPHSAERGMNALRAAGIAADKIVVLAPEPFEEYSFAQGERKTRMPWFAALGGLIGGTCGYLLGRYTQTAYPLITGGMPIVAAWPTGIVTYELTMMGAIVTTLITLSDWRAAAQLEARALRPASLARENSDRRGRSVGRSARRFGTATAPRRRGTGKVHRRPPK